MINSDQIYKIMRELAKTPEYQSLYSTSKELNFQLFKNNRDLSDIQVHFLSFLNFYATIFMDVYLKEVPEKVLENMIYEDAYTLYKSKREKETFNVDKSNNKETNRPIRTSPIQKDTQIKSKWHFKKRR